MNVHQINSEFCRLYREDGDSRDITWPEIRALYYDDHIDYDQALQLCELSYGTTHRPFGERACEASPETPSLLEQTGIRSDVSVDESEKLYCALMDCYDKGGLSWFDDISPLLPTSRGKNPERIRALCARQGIAI